MTTTTSPFTKSYITAFEQIGKRRKLIGVYGTLTDEAGLVLHSQLYDTKPQAEQALDALTHELLLDYAERGLVDTVPAELVSTPEPVADVNWNSATAQRPDPITARLAQALANTTQAPTYVVQQSGKYLIQDDTDLSVYFASVDPAAIVATFQPASRCTCGAQPTITVTHSDGIIDSVCRACFDAYYAHADTTPRDWSATPIRPTLDTLLTTQSQGHCVNCGGTHRTWQCPEIARALFAPPVGDWKDVDLGRELCRMRWKDFGRFVTLLRTVGQAGQLRSYAASYVAYLETYGPASLTIPQVLTVWGRIIGDGGDPGPAAPAMQVAA